MRDDNTTASQLRQWTTGALLACYVVPLVLLTIYNTTQLPFNKSWVVLTIGMLSALGGGTILFLLLRQWEGKLVDNVEEDDDKIFPESFPISAVEPSQDVREEIEHLADLLAASQQQCETLGEELHREQRILEALKREKEKFELQATQFQHMLDSQKESSNEDLQGKETLIEEYQLTITDQRTVIEKKQQLITQLETEIRDLRYELKTLVDISDHATNIAEEEVVEPVVVPIVTPKQIEIAPKLHKPKIEALDLGLTVASKSSEEAQQQLKRCIDIAQKLTGARHLAGDSARFRDLSADGYALDLRRLCDSFRSEHSCMIVLYSQRENKVLFVNNQVRGMVGLSPDKFLQNFPTMLPPEGATEWKGAIQKASIGHKAETTLRMKDHNIRCLLGAIPTGIFKTHIVAILYPES